jgi:hypothetical protein
MPDARAHFLAHDARRLSAARPDPFRAGAAQPPGNVGAAARAMKVMGFTDLVLVQPRFADVLQPRRDGGDGQRRDRHPGAPRIVPTLPEALEGVTWACATAMTPRDFGPPTWRRANTSRAWPAAATTWPSCSARSAPAWQRRRLPLPRLPVDSHAPRLRLAEPGAGGAAAGLRLAPGAGRLCRRAAHRRCRAGRRRAVAGPAGALAADAGADRLPGPGAPRS